MKPLLQGGSQVKKNWQAEGGRGFTQYLNASYRITPAPPYPRKKK